MIASLIAIGVVAVVALIVCAVCVRAVTQGARELTVQISAQASEVARQHAQDLDVAYNTRSDQVDDLLTALLGSVEQQHWSKRRLAELRETQKAALADPVQLHEPSDFGDEDDFDEFADDEPEAAESDMDLEDVAEVLNDAATRALIQARQRSDA